MQEKYTLQCGAYRLERDRPLIMAILNITSDSFSGDGLIGREHELLARAQEAVLNGADILDIGAESSRPGAPGVSEEEELARVCGAVSALRDLNVPLSIDTVRPSVMRAAIEAGASMINDINAFRSPGAIEVVADASVSLCVMHMQGEPRTMQQSPYYENVVDEVRAFLSQRVAALQAAGVQPARIVLDPGFGFGKTPAHNFSLLKHLAQTTVDGLPILAGLSRKSMLGVVTGQPVQARLAASLAAAVVAAEQGAHIVRVHDVAETNDALLVWRAAQSAV